jgi:hypothetical protein
MAAAGTIATGDHCGTARRALGRAEEEHRHGDETGRRVAVDPDRHGDHRLHRQLCRGHRGRGCGRLAVPPDAVRHGAADPRAHGAGGLRAVPPPALARRDRAQRGDDRLHGALLCRAGGPAHRAGGGGVLHSADLRARAVGPVPGPAGRALAHRGGGGGLRRRAPDPAARSGGAVGLDGGADPRGVLLCGHGAGHAHLVPGRGHGHAGGLGFRRSRDRGGAGAGRARPVPGRGRGAGRCLPSHRLGRARRDLPVLDRRSGGGVARGRSVHRARLPAGRGLLRGHLRVFAAGLRRDLGLRALRAGGGRAVGAGHGPDHRLGRGHRDPEPPGRGRATAPGSPSGVRVPQAERRERAP